MDFGAAAFFCPLANRLFGLVKTAMHEFRGKVCGKFTLKNCFFNCLDFEQRNLDFSCKNSGTFFKTIAYKSERKKFRKTFFGQLIYHHFWTLTRKNLEFTGQNLAGMSILNSMCPEKHIQSFVFERKSVKFQVFRKSKEVCATVAKIFLQVCKTEKNVQSNKLRKILSQNGKKITIFLRFWAKSSFCFGGKVREVCQKCNLLTLEGFEGKNVWNFQLASAFSGLWA